MSLYMKRLENKMPKNPNSSDSSDCENIERENEKDIERNQPTRATVRGNLAALISNLDNSDSDDSDSNVMKKSTGGLYARRLNQTKKERKNINHKFFEADKNLMTENEESIKKQNEQENEQKKFDIELADSDVTESVNKKKKIEEDESSESELEVPSPPPKSNRRKSTSLLYKHFKELESFRIKKDSQILLNDSDRVGFSNDDDDDELNTVTIRVSTKYGLKKWNINKNQSFSVIFENLAEIENTPAENLVLMLKDRIINFSDTPASINLKAYDILDCGKTASTNQERVKIVEDGECCEHGSNMVTLILQTDTGRKSRVKFLVSLDEPFESVLKKYCEKRELEFEKYLLQMEGDKIELTETPRDLDFEDDYMIDVVKSKKPVLQLVDENRKNYEFDDEILIV